MGFIKKIWKDRISEFPTRRSLTKTDGTSELVTVARSEGMISEEGDAFSAENMNDFENRVANGFSELNENLQNHGKIVKLLDNLSVTTSEKTVTVDDITKYRYLVIVFGGFSCMIPPELFKIKVKNYVNTTATSSDYLVSLIATYQSDTSISYILNIGSTSNKFSLYGVM